jgi:hypothetical protein
MTAAARGYQAAASSCYPKMLASFVSPRNLVGLSKLLTCFVTASIHLCMTCVQVAALEKQQQREQQQLDIAISDDHEGAGTVIHVRGPGSCSRMSDLGFVFDKLGKCTA